MNIDFSEIRQFESVRPDEEWEAPPHKFFGKKLPNGKMEKEPHYLHQNFPAMFFAQKDGKLVAKLVNNLEEYKLLGDGYTDTPADFGHIGAPSFEETLEMKRAKEEAPSEEVGSVGDQIAVAARRGRKPKETAEVE